MLKEAREDSKIQNRIARNDPRSAAVILAKRFGNHSAGVRNARKAINTVLADKGMPQINENWEGFVKAPSWYKGEINKVSTDSYVGGFKP